MRQPLLSHHISNNVSPKINTMSYHMSTYATNWPPNLNQWATTSTPISFFIFVPYLSKLFATWHLSISKFGLHCPYSALTPCAVPETTAWHLNNTGRAGTGAEAGCTYCTFSIKEFSRINIQELYSLNKIFNMFALVKKIILWIIQTVNFRITLYCTLY